MSWIPGWESIQATGWWSGFFFWASIVSLIGLGISEVASHRYSEKRDELLETQQRVEKKQHDDEIALLHLETARANREVAAAQADTAKANKATEELRRENLDLRTKIAGRRITPEQHDRLVSELSKNPGFFHMQSMTDGESALYAADLFRTLKDARWTSDTPEFPLGEVWHDLVLFQTDDPAALLLAAALTAADIPFKVGDNQHKRDKATLLVGAKPPPF